MVIKYLFKEIETMLFFLETAMGKKLHALKEGDKNENWDYILAIQAFVKQIKLLRHY